MRERTGQYVRDRYPALEKFERSQIPMDRISIYLGFAEVAKRWGIQPTTVRTLFRDSVRLSEWRYVPKPDIWLVRDDSSALPGWLEKTIDNFVRLEAIQGRGNHTIGAARRGNKGGAHTQAYRTSLGVTGAEKLRKDYAEGATVEKLAARWGMREDEVQDVLDGKRWVRGTGKDRPGLPRGVVEGEVVAS